MGGVFRKQTTVWRLAGKRVPAGTAGAEKAVVKSRKWYGAIGGRHVPLCKDRRAADQMLAKLEADAALAGVGIVDPFAGHKDRPLAEHLTDYAANLGAKGNTADHVRLTCGRVRALLDGCGFVYARDANPARAAAWLTALRRDDEPDPLPPGVSFTPAEAAALLGISGAAVRAFLTRLKLPATGHGKARRYPRATVEAIARQRGRGRGPETANHYVRAVRGFFRWLVRAKRVGSNPLDSLSLVNSGVDVRRARRELSADELRRLFDAARGSARGFRELGGEDRFFLYLTAAGTGFRANALANLTPADFALDAATPTVTLPARFAKNRRTKVQPLPPDVAIALRGYLAGKAVGERVWGGTWARDKRGAEMMRGDLAAAGIAYAVAGPDGPLYADFHALRHSYLTLGGRSGIDLRTLQELAGHSKPELTARYSHRRLNDLAGAVDRLPNLVPAPADGSPGRADGPNSVCTEFARTSFRPGQLEAAGGNKAGGESTTQGTTKPPTDRGFRAELSPADSGTHQRGRRDSNPQPPDRQSGTLTN